TILKTASGNVPRRQKAHQTPCHRSRSGRIRGATGMPATEEERTTIRTLEVEVAKINTSLRFLLAIGAFLATCAAGIFGSTLYVVHRAGQIEGSIGSLKSVVVALQKDTGE